MKTVYIDEKHIDIANTWDDITFKQWIDIAQLQLKREQDKTYQEIEFVLDLLNILTKMIAQN